MNKSSVASTADEAKSVGSTCRSILISGVGGQGTILASRLIAQAAILAGWNARTAETIGMAQRGGSVLGHVRCFEGWEKAPLSALISPGKADLLIGFEPAETLRALPYLKPQGTVITSTSPIIPAANFFATSAESDGYQPQQVVDWLTNLSGQEPGFRLIRLDGQQICAELESPKVLNTVLLGAAAASGALGLGLKLLEEALRELVSSAYLDVNLRALHRGWEQG
ncbi:MAG: indolepyruvate oxidoreductase subunit beta [Coriobacteriales bacterium]|jgi:indolepyruvate ferredoxin oxidoreductase beta subunit|nr:indolepyruvate oxidoreductase subunit beta [Coriobacteriales bacterium]